MDGSTKTQRKREEKQLADCIGNVFVVLRCRVSVTIELGILFYMSS